MQKIFAVFTGGEVYDQNGKRLNPIKNSRTAYKKILYTRGKKFWYSGVVIGSLPEKVLGVKRTFRVVVKYNLEKTSIYKCRYEIGKPKGDFPNYHCWGKYGKDTPHIAMIECKNLDEAFKIVKSGDIPYNEEPFTIGDYIKVRGGMSKYMKIVIASSILKKDLFTFGGVSDEELEKIIKENSHLYKWDEPIGYGIHYKDTKEPIENLFFKTSKEAEEWLIENKKYKLFSFHEIY